MDQQRFLLIASESFATQRQDVAEAFNPNHFKATFQRKWRNTVEEILHHPFRIVENVETPTKTMKKPWKKQPMGSTHLEISQFFPSSNAPR